MSNETYAYFKVYNHTNQLGVSSYALPFCNYKFVLELNAIEAGGLLSNKQVLWDYGDGTTAITLTGSHAYSQPGTYQVTCYLYDNDGEAYLNTYARNVVVSNYITDMISLSVANTSIVMLTAGRIDVPILVTRTNSYQSYTGQDITIVPYASGVNISPSYFDSASAQLYGHLEKYHAFYIEQQTKSGDTELVETEYIVTPSTKIYCKLLNGVVIHTTSDDPYAFFCGTSGQSLIYFKEDVAQGNMITAYQLSGWSAWPEKSGVFNIYPTGEPYEWTESGNTINQVRALSSNEIIAYASGDTTTWFIMSTYNGVDAYGFGIGGFINYYNPLEVYTNELIGGVGVGVMSAVNIFESASPVNLYFGFKSDTFDLNTSTIGLSTTIVPNEHFDTISITSNGIDGEGTESLVFDLNTNKFVGQKINFVAKIKDPDWYTIKSGRITSYTTALSTLTAPVDSTFTITSSANGYLKGYVVPNEAATDAFISITFTLCALDTTTTTISGTSDTFNILGSVTKLAKKGEDIDMLDKYKSLRFQELFLNKINLFDNFLGTIVGTISSDQNSVGKKVYEKIANFVDNNSNIDKCEIPQLVSILQSIDDQNILFEKVNFNYPVALKRLIDLLSIKHSKLFGARNTFDLDFYNYGNQLMGNNLGSRITDPLTYTITAGTDLVALEKYSGTFKKLNTYTPLSSESLSGQYTSQYPLSTYDEDWGWYLILNDDFVPSDFSKYYIFFEHENYVNDIEESVINFDDGNTTLQHSQSSYSDWIADNGTIDTLVNYQLALGLGLVSALSS